MSEGYVFHWAHDNPDPPWTGPYNSYARAVHAAQRDDGHGRVVWIKSAMKVGPNQWIDVHTEKVEPNSERNNPT